MNEMNEETGLDLTTTCIHLASGGDTECIPANDEFWARIRNRDAFQTGRLMGAFRITHDPSHWEVHPEGDEILYLLSGRMDVVMREQGAERVVHLRGRGVCIVPRGIWHKQVVHAPSEFVFVTPTKNTQTTPV